MNIIVMGPAGSGKSTQSEALARRLNLPHIETGDIYRAIAREDTPLGKKISEVMKTGGLLDDETTFEIVDKNLAKIKGGFVLDGFPRTLVQAKRELFPVDRVFYLHIPDAVSIARLLERKRADDKPEVIKERLMLYHERTEPILNYYRGQGILIEINGDRPVEEVSRSIIENL